MAVRVGFVLVVVMLTHTHTRTHTHVSGGPVDVLDDRRVTQGVSAVSCAGVRDFLILWL